MRADVAEDRERGIAVGRMVRRQRDEGFRDREAQLVGGGDDRRFGHRGVLDQRAFELERADPVIRGFEQIVGPADIGQIAVGVAHRHVAGAVGRARQRQNRALVALITLHQAQGRRVERQTDFAFRLLGAIGIEQLDPIAGRRLAHRSGLDLLAREIADLQGRLGLAVAVAHGQPPGRPDPLDHFGIERLAGAEGLAQIHPPRRQILLDQHPPNCRRGAERGDAAARDRVEQALGVEPRLVQHEHRRPGVPRREHTAIGVLGPARRRDVQMDVARTHAEIVHRREVPDRIALMAVEDQLRLGRRARGEIEQQGVARPGLAVGDELRRRVVPGLPAVPARRGPADRDPGVVAGQVGEFGGVLGGGDDMADPAAGEAVGEIVAVQAMSSPG